MEVDENGKLKLLEAEEEVRCCSGALQRFCKHHRRRGCCGCVSYRVRCQQEDALWAKQCIQTMCAMRSGEDVISRAWRAREGSQG
eukprot:6456411-Amphidinium_carterae.1